MDSPPGKATWPDALPQAPASGRMSHLERVGIQHEEQRYGRTVSIPWQARAGAGGGDGEGQFLEVPVMEVEQGAG